jgi:hypothetical protein
MLYGFVPPSQTDALPVMELGCVGVAVLTATAKVCAVELHPLLLAVTEIFPLVVLAVPLIDVVVELPVHPLGIVHV